MKYTYVKDETWDAISNQSEFHSNVSRTKRYFSYLSSSRCMVSVENCIHFSVTNITERKKCFTKKTQPHLHTPENTNRLKLAVYQREHHSRILRFQRIFTFRLLKGAKKDMLNVSKSIISWNQLKSRVRPLPMEACHLNNLEEIHYSQCLTREHIMYSL